MILTLIDNIFHDKNEDFLMTHQQFINRLYLQIKDDQFFSPETGGDREESSESSKQED